MWLQHGFCSLLRSGFLLHPFGGKSCHRRIILRHRKKSHIGRKNSTNASLVFNVGGNMLGTSDLKDSKDHWCNVQPLYLWVKSKYLGVIGIYLTNCLIELRRIMSRPPKKILLPKWWVTWCSIYPSPTFVEVDTIGLVHTEISAEGRRSPQKTTCSTLYMEFSPWFWEFWPKLEAQTPKFDEALMERLGVIGLGWGWVGFGVFSKLPKVVLQ